MIDLTKQAERILDVMYYFFLCLAVENKVMRQIVRVEMKSNSFCNFSDSAVSKAILNQVSFCLLKNFSAAVCNIL